MKTLHRPVKILTFSHRGKHLGNYPIRFIAMTSGPRRSTRIALVCARRLKRIMNCGDLSHGVPTVPGRDGAKSTCARRHRVRIPEQPAYFRPEGTQGLSLGIRCPPNRLLEPQPAGDGGMIQKGRPRGSPLQRRCCRSDPCGRPSWAPCTNDCVRLALPTRNRCRQLFAFCMPSETATA